MPPESSGSDEFTYLQFSRSLYHHEPRSLLKRLAAACSFFRTGWNRRLRKEYWNAKSWKVEYDQRNCATQREIGYDASDKPIVCAPSGAERGYWTEWHPEWEFYEDILKATIITQEEFEDDWKKLNP